MAFQREFAARGRNRPQTFGDQRSVVPGRGHYRNAAPGTGVLRRTAVKPVGEGPTLTAALLFHYDFIIGLGDGDGRRAFTAKSAAPTSAAPSLGDLTGATVEGPCSREVGMLRLDLLPRRRRRHHAEEHQHRRRHDESLSHLNLPRPDSSYRTAYG